MCHEVGLEERPGYDLKGVAEGRGWGDVKVDVGGPVRVRAINLREFRVERVGLRRGRGH